jgi:hypothetical protein
MVLADIAYSAGNWNIEKHIRYLANIRNVGRDCWFWGTVES